VTRNRQIPGWQNTLVCLLISQLVIVAGLAASPHLHQLLHHDADHADHECVVTIMISGGTDGSPVPQVLDAGTLFLTASDFSPEIQTADVAPLFLGAHVFEHAPPLA
jgi:hypothetical protein